MNLTNHHVKDGINQAGLSCKQGLSVLVLSETQQNSEPALEIVLNDDPNPNPPITLLSPLKANKANIFSIVTQALLNRGLQIFLTYSFSSVLKVIRVTGFMKGLYTDFELKSENVKVGMKA